MTVLRAIWLPMNHAHRLPRALLLTRRIDRAAFVLRPRIADEGATHRVGVYGWRHRFRLATLHWVRQLVLTWSTVRSSWIQLQLYAKVLLCIQTLAVLPAVFDSIYIRSNPCDVLVPDAAALRIGYGSYLLHRVAIQINHGVHLHVIRDDALACL